MTSLEKYIKVFRQNATDQFVLIAANKCDLDGISITMEDTAAWAATLDSECVWTSAKTGVGVNEVFAAVERHIVEVAIRDRSAPEQELNEAQSEIVVPQEVKTETQKSDGCC
jgi:50S ribosomal subunit-associated GTPase HflX